MCMGEIIYNWRLRPSKIFNWCILGKCILNKVVQKKLKLEEEEQIVTREYIKSVRLAFSKSSKI